jgi:phosphatidylglycerophosphate synthase
MMAAERELDPFRAWSAGHAAAMVAAALLVAAGWSEWTLSAAALLSFAALLHSGRGRFTPSGRFGAANSVTFVRIAACALLPLLAPVQVAAAALLLLAADGLDGRIARGHGLASPFGEHADKEADALLVLMLCVLLYRLPNGLGAWIVLPGVLRYLFVAFLLLARPPQPKERRTVWAGTISVVMLLTLAACFAFHPVPDALRLLAGAATILLCFSFARSAYALYGSRASQSRMPQVGSVRRARKSR